MVCVTDFLVECIRSYTANASFHDALEQADTNGDGRYTIKKFTRVFFGMTGGEYALLNAKA
jgi:Ca2+-binding EF-hand superfamily protein